MAVLADLHLSRGRAYAFPGFLACAAAAREAGASLTLVAGDLMLDDPDDAEDRAFARAAMEYLGDWHAVPGNHDMGDNVPAPWMDQHATPERHAAWLSTFGTDRFLRDVGDWRLIGLNSQILGTGWSAEAAQWEWLAAAAADAGRRRICLVMHKPMHWHGGDEPDGPNHMTKAMRARLAAALGGARLGLVVSGHLHQYRTSLFDGVPHVWAPSTGFIGRDHGLGAFGDRRPGLLLLGFEADTVAIAVQHATGARGVDAIGLIAVHGPGRSWPARPATDDQ